LAIYTRFNGAEGMAAGRPLLTATVKIYKTRRIERARELFDQDMRYGFDYIRLPNVLNRKLLSVFGSLGPVSAE
jgi:hypothetical protein